MKKILVSGIQSSGKLHIGNYFGAIKQNVELGNSGEYESFVFIADYHSMTSLADAKERLENTFDAACTYLACGLDITKVALFKQSDIPSHTELSWILNTVTPISLLDLAHSFKDKLNKALEETIGENNYNNSFYKSFISEHKNHTSSQLHAILGEDSLIEDLARHYNLKNSEVKFLISSLINASVIVSEKVNSGLFTYPVLMAADILMYNANIVPVGKDQEQHVEIARELAGKFNRAYNTELFVMPQAYIKKEVATVPGIDGTKMSKSKNNHIPLFGTDEEIKKKVMSIVTDSARPEDTKNPDESAIYQIHKLFINEEEDTLLRARFTDGGYGYKEAKEKCAEAIIAFVSPMREKYNYYQTHRDEVFAILEEGKKKASVHADEMMKKVRVVTGLE